jgi:hypothetical protein
LGLGELFIKMKNQYNDEEKALDKVKMKYFKQMCSHDIDTYFFVGTDSEHNSWMVLGVFYPKRAPQVQLSLL